LPTGGSAMACAVTLGLHSSRKLHTASGPSQRCPHYFLPLNKGLHEDFVGYGYRDASTGHTLAQRPHLQQFALSTVYLSSGNVMHCMGTTFMQSCRRVHFDSSHSMVSPMRKCILALPCCTYRSAAQTTPRPWRGSLWRRRERPGCGPSRG